MGKDRELSVGIIGAGGIANNVHIPCLLEMDNVRIEAVCDIIEARAESVAQKFNIPNWYTNYHRMVSDIDFDAVFILVTPDQTFRITYDCLNYGLDIFVEKPLGITSFQAQTLADKARETGSIVQVGFNRRYIPLVREVLRAIKDETTITQVEGCFFKNTSARFYDGCASSFICDTIHAIDLVRAIAGGQPKNAATLVNQYNSPVPNSWNSIIEFDNGVTGIIKSNYQTGGRVHAFEIHGHTASAYINLGFGGFECDAKIIFHRGRQSHSAASAGEGDVEIIHYDGKTLAGSDDYHKYYGFFDEVCVFINSIQARQTPEANLDEAVKTMALAEMLVEKRI